MDPVYISAQEIENVIDVKELISSIECALRNFSDKASGGVVQPVRSVVEVKKYNGLLGVMPGFSENEDALATKLVTVYPNANPSHKATILLFNPANGSLQAIMDGVVITDFRTAAASAVASKYLAKPESTILALLGAGHQAKSHFKVLSHLFRFNEVRVWSRTIESATSLATEIHAKVYTTVQEAVKDADIIVTATFSETPILNAEWVKQGAHINAVGACRPHMQEIHSDLMRQAVVYVDTKEGALKESGDIVLSSAEVYAELGEVVGGEKTAFVDKLTLFKSLGMAVEDVVSAKLVYDRVMGLRQSEKC